jgi:hypothetical protein
MRLATSREVELARRLILMRFAEAGYPIELPKKPPTVEQACAIINIGHWAPTKTSIESFVS